MDTAGPAVNVIVRSGDTQVRAGEECIDHITVALNEQR